MNRFKKYYSAFWASALYSLVFGGLYALSLAYVQFAEPKKMFWVLLALPLIFVYTQQKNYLSWSYLPYTDKGLKWKQVFLHIPFAFGLVAFALGVLALAKPEQSEERWQQEEREGIEMVIALDLSGSMLAMDFVPNRLEASKQVAIAFIEKRKQDKIGLVFFEGQAYLQCPVTSDKSTLVRLFSGAKTGRVEGGTAIGAGLATALSALRSSTAKSRVVILLTDGVEESNSQISPELALEMAKTLNIRVYTIGVGTMGKAPFPAQDAFGRTVYVEQEVRIDEPLLQKIAKETGGEYYRAKNEREMENIYADIEKLEKDKLKIIQHSKIPEYFLPFLMMALLLLLFALLFALIVFV